MESVFGRTKLSVKALSDFSNLDKATRHHLKNVYSSLTITMVAASLGAVLYFVTGFALSLFGVIGSVILLLALWATPHAPENTLKRLGILGGFGLCTGFSLGPLLATVVQINPSIIPTAFIGSCVIFACFSLTALYSERRTWLFLGGFLMSGLSLMAMMMFFNIFLHSYLIMEFDIYFGLLLFCGFILFDTQLIVERFSRGDSDYIWHSVNLFLDFVNIFVRLLAILASKEKKKSNKNR